MSTPATSDAFQPRRKEKSKPGFNNSADSQASGVGKNLRKTKPISTAHCPHGHTNHPPIFAAVHREEARRAALKKSRGPAPKRGDVKAAIFKGVVDATWACLCASSTFTHDADAFLDSVPYPKKSQPMAKFWPLMDAPVLQE